MRIWFRNVVIGLELVGDQSFPVIRAVALRRSRIVWQSVHKPTPAASPSANWATCFAALPPARWGRRSVVVSLGPSWAQHKQLHGLPTIGARRALAQTVAHGAGRFFLRATGDVSVSELHVDRDHSVWAAAAATALLSEIVRASQMANVKLLRIVATPRSDHRLPDGLDQEFAGAYFAAKAGREAPVGWSPSKFGSRKRVPRWRIGVAAGSLACALAAAVAAPGLAARRADNQAIHSLSQLTRRAHDASEARSDLRHVSTALGEVSTFSAHRALVTFLMRDLARTLPNRATLVALTIDSTDGTLEALAPHAQDVLNALEHVATVASPRVIGPITPELVSEGTGSGAPQSAQGTLGHELERVTIRFRVVAAASSAAGPTRITVAARSAS